MAQATTPLLGEPAAETPAADNHGSRRRTAALVGAACLCGAAGAMLYSGSSVKAVIGPAMRLAGQDITYYDNDEEYWEGIDIIDEKVTDTEHVMATYMQYTCEYNDDDYVFMNHSYCSGDIDVYNSYVHKYNTKGTVGYKLALEQCSFAATGENHNMSWFVPCMWDTVSHMDQYCNGGYNVSDDYMSKESRNAGRNDTYFSLNMTKTNVGVNFDACNLHAFCHACIREDGSINEYCKAYVELYNNLDFDGGSHFFKNANEYWCNETVLTDIKTNHSLPWENGTLHIRSPGHTGGEGVMEVDDDDY